MRETLIHYPWKMGEQARGSAIPSLGLLLFFTSDRRLVVVRCLHDLSERSLAQLLAEHELMLNMPLDRIACQVGER